MKLRSLIEKIGFSKHLSKSVEDVAADKFEDFGINVGQLYQTFLKKDLSADPAIAQKIMDMVDTDDNNALANQIKDLAFLINQLPDKLEKKDKIGFREITYRPKGEDPDKGAELKTNKIKLKDLTPESYHPINSPIDLIDKDILDIPDGSVGEIKRAAAKLGIDPQNKYESELRDEIEDLLTSRMSTYEEYELVKKYFGDYADELIHQYGLQIDEEQIYGFDFHYTHGTSGGTQQFGRPRMVAEAEDRSFSTSNINIPGTAKSDWDPFLRSVLFPKEKEKKYTRYLQRIDWSKKTDKEIRDIGGDAYYGVDTQKEPVKGRMRILVPPEKGWPMMRLDSKGDPTGQYVFPGEKNHPVKDPKNPPKEMSWISKELRGHMTEMTDDEFEKAKELDRLEKHPEKDKIKKVQQLIRKQIKELWLKK